jgi:poly(hydroxyalkanoate) granule-associated protein
MPTKTQSGEDKNLQDDLKESAHRIWLAGLGALAAAEEEGTKLFSRLVDRGRDVEQRGKVEVDKVKTKAEDAWSGVGSKIDEAVTGALHRLGVPTREEIRRLTQRVEELNAKVEQLKPRVTPAGAGSSVAGEEKSAKSSRSSAKVV